MSVIFVYRCASGNESIEQFFRMGEAPETVICPDHGSLAKRQVSNGNFLSFPGSYKAAHPKT